jgi:hypothetical protein
MGVDKAFVDTTTEILCGHLLDSKRLCVCDGLGELEGFVWCEMDPLTPSTSDNLTACLMTKHEEA